MSTIVYGPQLKELVLDELSDSEYMTTSDPMKILVTEPNCGGPGGRISSFSDTTILTFCVPPGP